MKLTEKDYELLIGRFEFLNDKVESCYKEETDSFVNRLKEEYKKYVD